MTLEERTVGNEYYNPTIAPRFKDGDRVPVAADVPVEADALDSDILAGIPVDQRAYSNLNETPREWAARACPPLTPPRTPSPHNQNPTPTQEEQVSFNELLVHFPANGMRTWSGYELEDNPSASSSICTQRGSDWSSGVLNPEEPGIPNVDEYDDDSKSGSESDMRRSTPKEWRKRSGRST